MFRKNAFTSKLPPLVYENTLKLASSNHFSPQTYQSIKTYKKALSSFFDANIPKLPDCNQDIDPNIRKT